MVYRGKPSKGCHACRKRKIRCDQTPLPQGCSQCSTKGQACPGYRDQLDLLFANESESVAQKVKARSRDKSKTPEGSSSEASLSPSSSIPSDARSRRDSMEVVPQSSGKPLVFSMAPTLQDRGEGFFFHNYCVDVKNFLGISYGSSPTSSILSSCITAFGLAGLSTLSKDPSLMVESRKNYINALRLTNKALSSPVQAKKDTTLLSILILSGYETLTGSEPPSLAAWSSHVNGAAALLKLRGPDQFRTVAGRQMFSQVAFTLLTSCLTRLMPVPEHILTLREEAMKHVPDRDNKAWQAQDLMLQFTDFHGKYKQGYYSERSYVLKRSFELRSQFDATLSDLALTWGPKIVREPNDPDFVPLGYYHTYSSYWVVQVWNGLRSMCIMLDYIIRDNALLVCDDPEERKRLHREATQRIRDRSKDLIASVPQQIGYCQARRGNFKDLDETSIWPRTAIDPYDGNFNSTSSLLPIIRISSGYSLLWPLCVVGYSTFVSQETRLWILKILRFIGQRLGIKQALLIAKIIEANKTVNAVYSDGDYGVEPRVIILQERVAASC